MLPRDQIQSFAVVPLHPTPGGGTPKGGDCNLTATRVVNTTVSVRELLAFTPFYFPGLVPNASSAKYEPMWQSLTDPQGLAGPLYRRGGSCNKLN